MREQTRRAVEGRVAGAEKAAAEVLEEARALSGGLRQLGKSLEDHADRILRDVQAAHKRMQADLRVGLGRADEPAPSSGGLMTSRRGAAAEPSAPRGWQTPTPHSDRGARGAVLGEARAPLGLRWGATRPRRGRTRCRRPRGRRTR